MTLIRGPHLWPSLFSDIHSLSKNKSSAKGVYAVFAALQVNPSVQKLEWVQLFMYFSLVNIFHSFKWCYNTCIDGAMCSIQEMVLI